jgi:hypothetical protein
MSLPFRSTYALHLRPDPRPALHAQLIAGVQVGPDAKDEVGAGAGGVDAPPGVVRVGAGVEAHARGSGAAVDDSEEREVPPIDERRRPLRMQVGSANLDRQRVLGRRHVVVVAASGDDRGDSEQQRELSR